jgi:hypothetical protein
LGRRVFRKTWAVTRWVVLVLVVGLGIAAVLGFAIAALVTTIENSV